MVSRREVRVHIGWGKRLKSKTVWPTTPHVSLPLLAGDSRPLKYALLGFGAPTNETIASTVVEIDWHLRQGLPSTGLLFEGRKLP